MLPHSRLLAIAGILDVVLGGVHEKLIMVPQGWFLSSSVLTSNHVATFSVVLNRDFTNLQSQLLEVSTPGHPNYGKYLDHDAVNSAFAPSADAVSSVVGWLKSKGISDYKVDNGFVDFVADIVTANSIFNASYQYYSNNGATKLRTLQYSIPDNLQDHIAFVEPGTFFGQANKKSPVVPTKTKRGNSDFASTAAVDAACATSITPPCLKQLYYVGDYKADRSSGSRIGFGSFLNESALYSDLEQFEELFNIPSQNISKVLIAGGVDDQDPSHGNYGEANLDAQTIIGVANPLPVTEFITGGSP